MLFTESSLETLKACKFGSVEEFNKALNILISRMSTNLEINEKSEEENLKKMEYYLEDLNYETEFIGAELKKFEARIRELLVVKSSSPLVLHLSPQFCEPKLVENVDMIYIGEVKGDRPHGLGVAYYKNSQKVIYGSFHGGHIDGCGELYFNSGDYYIGDFKGDKK